MNLRELKKQHNEHVQRIKALNAIEEKEERDLSESESKEIETRYADAEALKKKIEHREKMKNLELAKTEDIVPKQEKREYSLSKAIKCLISKKIEGYEGEVHRELEKRGNDFEDQGLLIPASEIYGKLETRIVDNQSALVSDPIKPELAQLSLREASIMDKLGVRRISATGNFNYPKNSNATTSGFFSGDGGADANDSITASDATFTSESVEPHFLGSYTGWSLKQLKQMAGNLSLESLLRRNMSMSMAEELDRAMLNGNKTSKPAEPNGLLQLLGSATNNTTVDRSASDKNWKYSDLTEVIKELKIQYKNNRLSPRWLINPLIEEEWSLLQKFTSTDGDSLLDAVMKKNPVVVSNHLANTNVLFGDFSELIVTTFDTILLSLGMVNSDFAKGVQRLRAIGCFSFTLDRKEGFRQITVTR